MKVVKFLLLLHPEGGEIFTPSVTVHGDKDFVICVVCSTVLTAVGE